MIDLNDTVCAIATLAPGIRTILRITGPKALEVCRGIVREALGPNTRGISSVGLVIGPDLVIEGRLYLFPSPHSYTGQTMAEIHIEAGPPVIETLVQALLRAGVSPAGPGEFTARAYLNGRIDLAAAEAVNEVVTATNHIQCQAAEKLLQGQLSSTLDCTRSQILETLGLIEAGLDFPEEDITRMSKPQMVEALRGIMGRLEALVSDAFQADSIAHLPSVGIAGAPNAGKSTLFNALLGSPRSIVSDRPKTTRDVLEAVLDLEHGRCVLFDCAGLLPHMEDILDCVIQQAAFESLRRSRLVLFCVDLAKSDWQDDLTIRRQVASESLIAIATKGDLLGPTVLARRLDEMALAFGQTFLPVSAKTGMGLEALYQWIDGRICSMAHPSMDAGQPHVLLSARIRQAGAEAIDHLGQAIQELEHGQEEIAAMMMRAAYQSLCETDRHVDEKVLDAIFSRFCIGK